MVNQLLTEMDGFRGEELVFVVGTTNLVGALDPALLRPGRFELTVEIPYPGAKDRREILEIYQRKFNLDLRPEVLEYMVEQTGGYVDPDAGVRFSGDHLYALMRALKREEIRRHDGRLEVSRADIDVALGERRRPRPEVREEEARTIAAHEAGHAVVAHVLPHCPAVTRVALATGEDDYLGVVMQELARNQYVRTREELLDEVCVALAGRVAEELLVGQVSCGAASDLDRATYIAQLMVERWGMSEAVGLRVYSGDRAGDGQEAGGAARRLSEQAAGALDREIGRILAEQADRARDTLTFHREELEQVTGRLVAERTLREADLAEIFGGRRFKAGGDDPGATTQRQED